MNIFGGFGGNTCGTNNCCNIIWLLFLLQMCGCNTCNDGCGTDNTLLIVLLLLCGGCGTNKCC